MGTKPYSKRWVSSPYHKQKGGARWRKSPSREKAFRPCVSAWKRRGITELQRTGPPIQWTLSAYRGGGPNLPIKGVFESQNPKSSPFSGQGMKRGGTEGGGRRKRNRLAGKKKTNATRRTGTLKAGGKNGKISYKKTFGIIS